MEAMYSMTARKIVNFVEWLKVKKFSSDDIADCIEAIEGRKIQREE